jgi:hypothetical protein
LGATNNYQDQEQISREIVDNFQCVCRVALDMSDQELLSICEAHGITVDQLRQNIRESGLRAIKSKIVIYMRDSLQMSYQEIADACGYFDRSGARQAYEYAKTL